VTCINDAKGGASTKTYLQEGYWEKALADKPDYMLIQFGHNDEESKEHQARETNLQTEYPVNLEALCGRSAGAWNHPGSGDAAEPALLWRGWKDPLRPAGPCGCDEESCGGRTCARD
jgi:lysophospholipase L1-like esterase